MALHRVSNVHTMQQRCLMLGILLFASCMGVLLGGCGSDNNSNSTASLALVRTFNAYVATAGTDSSIAVSAGGLSFTGTGNVAFGQFANNASCTSVTSGAFTPSLTGPSIATPVTYQTTLNGSNATYTLVAAGEQGQTGTLTPQLLLLPNYTPGTLSVPSGSAAIRVINVSLNTNPLGLYTTTDGTPTAPLASGLGSIPFGYSGTTSGYVAVPVTQIANLTLVDTANPATALTLSSTSNLTTNVPTFVSGQAYTLLIYGQAGNSTQPLGTTWIQDYP